MCSEVQIQIYVILDYIKIFTYCSNIFNKYSWSKNKFYTHLMVENDLNAPQTLNHGNTFSAITSEEEADQNRHLSVDGSVTVDPSDALRCRKCDERIQSAQNAARGDAIPDCPQLGDRRRRDHRDEQDIQFTVPG